MRMLLLGGSGFVGGAVLRRVLDAGIDVRVMARDSGALEARGAEVRSGDLGDPQSIADAAEGCTHVVNAAGIASCRAHPRALQWTHVAGAENLVNACKHAGVKRLVHVTCTDVTLGNLDRVHWDENKTLHGAAYGDRARSLQLGEELVMSTAGLDVETVSLRAAWVWGPGDTSRLPGLCREGLDGGVQLVGDGRTYFATTYVTHLVEAVMAALEAEDAGGQMFHIVDPVFQHARDFFGALSAALDLPPPRSSAPLSFALPLARLRGKGPAGLRPDEMLQRGRSTLFDLSAASGKLSFEPSVGFDDGLKATRAWVDAQGGAKAVAALEKSAPGASSVDAQVEAAGGD